MQIGGTGWLRIGVTTQSVDTIVTTDLLLVVVFISFTIDDSLSRGNLS